MAISELFRRIGQDYFLKASRTTDEEISRLYQDAAALSLEGNMGEARKKGEAAQELLAESSTQKEEARRLEEEFLPGVLAQLKEEFGIEDPPVEFLQSIDPRLVPEQVQTEQDLGRKEETPFEEKISALEQRKLVFTPIQLRAVTAHFRLLDDPNIQEASFEDAIQAVYPAEEIEEAGMEAMKVRVTSNWKGAMGKLRRGFDFLTLSDTEVRLPFDEGHLEQLAFSPETQRLYRSLGEVEAYQSMSLDELFDYTKSWGSVRLAVGAEAIQGSSPHTFSKPEAHFLAKQLLEKSAEKLTDGDRDFLDHTVDTLWREGLDVDDDDSLSKSLLEKFQAYRDLDEVARGEFFDAQSETGQVLLGIVIGHWQSPEDLQSLLSPEVSN